MLQMIMLPLTNVRFRTRVWMVIFLLLFSAAALTLQAAPTATQPTTRPSGVATANAPVPETITSPLGKRLRLKFHDEFNAVPDKDGKPYVDRSKWQTTFWQGSSQRCLFANGEAQYYMDKDYGGAGNLPVEQRPNPFSFETPGVLTISAFRVPESLWKNYWMGKERPFCSGLLISDKHFTYQYGYVEGRFKLPADRGAWPAFWLLGDDPTRGKPELAHEWGPEVDVFEFFGHRPTKHSAGVVTRKDDKKPSFTFGYNEVGSDITRDFHTWGFEWDAEQMVWTFDGKIWARTQTPASMKRPMYLLINLAVGGNWYSQEMKAAGHEYKQWEVDEASMPWHMQCDYVRVYQ